MNTASEKISPVATKIIRLEIKLEQLALAISEIGLPASTDLKRRWNLLQIEERALKRNFDESKGKGQPDTLRILKIEALLAHIEKEESSMAHDAAFLHQASPSSMALLAEMGVHVMNFIRKGIKQIIGNHHPLGSSVFVNHSHDNLVAFHGLREERQKPEGD
jgi:hypothetical protein